LGLVEDGFDANASYESEGQGRGLYAVFAFALFADAFGDILKLGVAVFRCFGRHPNQTPSPDYPHTIN